jgi:cell division protein FtsW
MSRLLYFDRKLFTVTLGLLAAGLVMIYSSSAVLALTRKGDPGYFFKHQLLWAVVGVVALFVTQHIDYRRWGKRRVVLGLMALEVVLLLMALASPSINGSHRWIKVGSIAIGQPSEAAKLVILILAAYLLNKRAEERREWIHTLVPLGAYAGLVAVLIVIQPDLGTVVILGAILCSLLLVAGLPWKWLVSMVCIGVVAVGILAVSSPYRRQRLMTFMNPDADPRHEGFQAQQSLIAVGSGGLVGNWLGGGSQKMLFLPEPHTDFIFAMIGEELGFAGNLVVLGSFLFFGYLGLKAVRSAPDLFGAYLAMGVVAWVVLQALVHIMVTLTLLPTKGLPLPLLSYGGSNLVVTMAGVGILLNVSQHE